MKAIQKKLHSERGASISFALLLFLVCTTVGSVILVAATSASGRLSRLAVSDRRYYSVTSAAGLLKEKYDGASAVIVEKTSSRSTQTYTMGGTAAGAPVVTSEEPVVTVNGEEEASSRNSLMTDAAWRLVRGSAGDFPFRKILTLAPRDQSSEERKGLSVQVEEYLTGDGHLELRISSGAENSAAAETYRLCLSFEAEKNTDTDSRTVEGTARNVGPDSYEITTTTTVTTTTRVTWRLSGVETVSGQASQD